MVKQDTRAISCSFAISSKGSEEQLSQLTPTGQISSGVRTVIVPVFSWVSGDTGMLNARVCETRRNACA